MLRAAVAAGHPGDRLPSVREIMDAQHVSPVTVQRAMRQLVTEGLIEVQPGRGSFIAVAEPAGSPPADTTWQLSALGAKIPGDEALPELLAVPRPETIPMSTGYLDARLQPVAALGAALGRAARRPAAWERGPVEGREELRAWFAQQAGGAFRAGDMIICPGAQSALSTAFRALASPGSTVLVENPTYLGAIAAARGSGLGVVPVPVDADGVRPDHLADALTRTGARLFYCQPLYANPHGAVLSPSRRAAVLEIMHSFSAFLIEDDWARDLTIEGTPPPPLASHDQHGHVVYLRSLTKPAAPGLRVAAIGARGAGGARLRTARVRDDFFVSGPLQEAALDFLSSPAWQRHRKALQTALRTRRDALMSALRVHAPALEPALVPAGGMHIWARLPDGTDDITLTSAAARHGVIVYPGHPWYAADPPAPHLRLTYAGAPPEVLEEGIRRLARALADLT
jgi:DNA-binding transcriptional MocR family regulator